MATHQRTYKEAVEDRLAERRQKAKLAQAQRALEAEQKHQAELEAARQFKRFVREQFGFEWPAELLTVKTKRYYLRNFDITIGLARSGDHAELHFRGEFRFEPASGNDESGEGEWALVRHVDKPWSAVIGNIAEEFADLLDALIWLNGEEDTLLPE